jgi:hypothetical protein
MNRFRAVSFATVMIAALTAGVAHAAPPMSVAHNVAAQEHRERGHGEGRPATSPRARPPAAPHRAVPAPQSRTMARPAQHPQHAVVEGNRRAPERNYNRGVVHNDRVYRDRDDRRGFVRDYRRDAYVRHNVYGGRDYDRFFRERYAYRPYWRSYGYAFIPAPIAIYPSLAFLSDGVCVGSYWQFGHEVYLYAVMRFGVREQIEVRDDGVILSEEPLPDFGY